MDDDRTLTPGLPRQVAGDPGWALGPPTWASTVGQPSRRFCPWPERTGTMSEPGSRGHGGVTAAGLGRRRRPVIVVIGDESTRWERRDRTTKGTGCCLLCPIRGHLSGPSSSEPNELPQTD